jgi:hypothetical protein
MKRDSLLINHVQTFRAIDVRLPVSGSGVVPGDSSPLTMASSLY